MKNQYDIALKKQKGAATFTAAVILLVAMTLLTMLTAKTVLQETKMTANNYRSSQAIANADAAMDYALVYFDKIGLDADDADADDGGRIDDVDVDGDGTNDIQPLSKSTIKFYINDGACTTANDAKSALIITTGTSDDEVAFRTITQCVGTINVFSEEGPQQPLISKRAVAFTGNFNVINRVNNNTVWSGSGVNIGSSSSASTYIWSHSTPRPDVTVINRDIFESIATPLTNVDIISTKDMGLGVDVIENDATLASLDVGDFFEGFFPGDDGVPAAFSGRDKLKGLAEDAGQLLNVADAGYNLGDLDDATGIMWIDGDVDMTGLTIGTSDEPAVLIINGNLNVSGNPVIHGVLYVVGQVDATGTLNVIGSTIVEGNDVTMSPDHVGEDPVVGTGSVNLTYTPFTQHLSERAFPGTATVISGSWRDW